MSGRRALIVSSFVRPHAGGVEEFVETAAAQLRERGWSVRVLACRLTGHEEADAVVPSRRVGGSGWPVPVGGWRTLWRESGAADVVVANNARQLLSVAAVVAARARRRGVVVVVHGSGEGGYAGARAAGAAREVFQRTAGLLAIRLSRPVSVSLAGVAGVRRLYGADARHVPFPVRPQEPAPPLPLAHEEEMRIVWVGRLSPEKGPLDAVAAVDALRSARAATLSVCGEGPLRPGLERLAATRSWLTLLGPRPWDEVQGLQAAAHACLSTSVADNVQVAVLEALCRGIPTVSTRVGDAPAYYLDGQLAQFCVRPREPAACAAALAELAENYDRHRSDFLANAEPLRARHAASADALEAVLLEALMP